MRRPTRSRTAVILDLFNEPHIDNFPSVTGYRDPTAWAAANDDLITTASGTPTDGYGGSVN